MRVVLAICLLFGPGLALAQVLPAGSPVSEALDAIAKRYGVNVAYSGSAVAGRELAAALELQRLDDDLEAVLTPVGLRHARVGRQYIITVAPVRRIGVSGFVEDRETRERLVGATVYAVGARRGGASNGYGFFRITDLDPGERLVIRYLGYAPDTVPAAAFSPGPATVALRQSLQLLTVEVTENVTSTAPVHVEGVGLSPKLLDRTQLLNGSRDVNSWLAHRAGVVSAANGYRGYGFRGADPEHNLTLLDDANLYLPSHAVGYFSIVPGAAVRSWRLYRDAGPARYGDRVGGVLDLRLREGNRLERGGSVDLGISDVTGTYEGPLGNGSFFVSGRRALSDFWLDVFRPDDRVRLEARPEVNFGFYDVAAKVNQRIGERQQVYASVFFGRDRYRDAARAFLADADEIEGFTSRSKRVWQNALGSVRHSIVLGDRWFANSTLTVSDFRYASSDSEERSVAPLSAPDSARVTPTSAVYDSRIRDLGLKSDLQYALSPEFVATLGVDGTLHRFSLDYFSQASAETAPEGRARPAPVFTLDFSTYISFDYRPSPRLHATGGLRLSSQLSRWGALVAPLPRFRAEYALTERLRVYGGVTESRQYVHRISTNNPGLPRDIWVPTIRGLRALSSTHVSTGFALTPSEALSVSVTGYARRLRGVTRLDNDFRGEDFDDWIVNLREGRGGAYGLELELGYELPRWSLEGTYTLARATRRYQNSLGRLGEVERARLDRRHAGSALLEYRHNDRWTFTGAARAGSGLPARRPFNAGPVGAIFDPGVPLTNGLNYDGEIVELRPFFSLDLGVRLRPGPKAIDQELSFGAQNVTLRRNPLYFNIRNNPDSSEGERNEEVTEVFAPPILPFLRFVRRF